jgi:pimeloyl-ACP methyl ester carboxylesterase
MAAVSSATTTGQRRRASAKLPPPALRALAERFDADLMDIPGGRARIRLEVGDASWEARISPEGLELARARGGADAVLGADAGTWRRIASDVRGGMDAFRAGRLSVRRNLHLGVGFLAATSGMDDPGRLRFDSVPTRAGSISILSAGTGDPVICVHGLGGTKASFLPTVAALAETHRVIAMDLPGFGESDKPMLAPYDAPYFTRAVVGLMDALDIPRAHVAGNSMGGRVALELGLRERDRLGGIVLLSPALAWLKDRPWKALLQLPIPRLGLVQPAPRWITEPIVRRIVPGGTNGWAAAGVDEFLRAYLTPKGRAAFYAAAANIYLDEPRGERGFWTRLRELGPPALFVWGRQDTLVPISFMRHVEEALPGARHVELDCGHVPQLEDPDRTHAAMRDFLGAVDLRQPA